jgi:dienelactone hydrolase
LGRCDPAVSRLGRTTVSNPLSFRYLIITLMVALLVFSIGLVVLAIVEDYRAVRQRISRHVGGGIIYITPGDILLFFLAIAAIGIVWGSLAAALEGYVIEFSIPFMILVVIVAGGLFVANIVRLIRKNGISFIGRIWRIVLTIPYVIFSAVWVVMIGHATFIYFTKPFQSIWIELGISIVNLICILGILALSIISVQALAEGSKKPANPLPYMNSLLGTKQISGPKIVPAVWGVLEIPHTPGPHPGVILLTGSSGWKDAYPEIAKSLSASGFVALAIDYLAETGYEPSSNDQLKYWPIWQAIVRNAVACLQASPSVSRCGIGLVGYSLGAFLAVSVATTLQGVGAVVDFFGGGSSEKELLEAEVRHFPPLLIIHGEADSIVPVSNAYRLRNAVMAQGGEVETHIYPGAEHGFNAPWSPWYSAPEASDSLTRMIGFLAKRLRE